MFADFAFLAFVIIVFIITLLVLVVIHELGHFIVAKRFDIKVLEFGFGIPPRAWGKKIGETIWSLNWLPLGGFVRLLGEDEVDSDVLSNKRSFAARPVWQRMSVVVAGVLMNLLLAWALFYLVLGAQGFKTKLPLLTDYQFVGMEQNTTESIVMDKVIPDSPAGQTGLADGDKIIALNNANINDVDELVRQVKAEAGKPVNLTISDFQGGNTRTVTLTPRANPPKDQGALGVSLGVVREANLSLATPMQKLFAGPVYSYNLLAYSGSILSKLIDFSVKERSFEPVGEAVAGPIGIVVVVKQILSGENPTLRYLDFVAALSLNLAIVNILPFPGLDGGRFLFLAIEGITRKKTHAIVEKYVHAFGLFFLIGLIILISISDIKKILLPH